MPLEAFVVCRHWVSESQARSAWRQVRPRVALSQPPVGSGQPSKIKSRGESNRTPIPLRLYLPVICFASRLALSWCAG